MYVAKMFTTLYTLGKIMNTIIQVFMVMFRQQKAFCTSLRVLTCTSTITPFSGVAEEHIITVFQKIVKMVICHEIPIKGLPIFSVMWSNSDVLLSSRDSIFWG